MNHFFKILWSNVRHEYVVTNEKHTTHGKPTKALSLAIVSAFLILSNSSANASYTEAGVLGNSNSWESDEYLKDWGLKAMNASSAYALGFNGSNIQTGMMDTGALSTHPEFDPKRYSYVKFRNGRYSSSGNRYPVPGFDTFGNGAFEIGQSFLDSLSHKGRTGEIKSLTGDWVLYLNDSHGTHVVGTIGANRDGHEMHGVAWGANVLVGNNGGLDNSNYGPYQDYAFYKSIYEDLVAARGTNGKTPMFINSSWGTNIRVLVPKTDPTTGEFIQGTESNYSMPVNTMQETEYEYFLFNAHARQNWAKAKAFNTTHNIQIAIPHNPLDSFIDGMYEAVKNKNVVHMITTGNRPYAQPYYRANYPYFNPNSEHHWVAVGGLQKNEDGTYQNIASFNAPGEAKWWSVVAPGRSIYSTVVCDDDYIPPSDNRQLGKGYYSAFSGTSMANPHVTGAMTVLASRYQDMDAFQVRNTLFTTANHKNTNGTDFSGWTAKEGTPDPLYGWGVPDLKKGLYGPAQFLGKFDDNGHFHPNFTYRLHGADVWTNDITQVAHDARLEEEKNWLDNTYSSWKNTVGVVPGKQLTAEQAQALAKTPEKFKDAFKLDGQFDVKYKVRYKPNGQKEVITKEVLAKDAQIIGGYKTVPLTDEEKKEWVKKHPNTPIPKTKEVAVLDDLRKINLADAILWRDIAYEKRAAAMKERAKYDKLGLVKDGVGTLALLGKAQYKGDTVVKQGQLYALGKTFGNDTGKVIVQGGTFGITPVYIDQLTLQGRVTDNTASQASIEIKSGGTLSILVSKAALNGTVETTHVKSLTLEDGATLELNSLDWSKDVPAADQLKGETAENFRKENATIDLRKIVMEAKKADFAISSSMSADAPIQGDLSKVKNVETIAVKQTSQLNDVKTTLTVTLSKKSAQEQTQTISTLGLNNNETEVVKHLGAPLGLLTTDLRMVKNNARQYTSDYLPNVQTASLVNVATLTHALLERSASYAHMNTVDTYQGRLWGLISGHRGKVKLGTTHTKTQYTSALIGGEIPITTETTLGIAAGYSHGDLNAQSFGKTKTRELHAGLYARTQNDTFKLTGGALFTHTQNDMTRRLGDLHRSKYNINHLSAFSEIALKAINTERVQLEPYGSLNWIRIQGKDLKEGKIITSLKDRNVYSAGVGVRVQSPLPLTSVPVTIKGKVGYQHFFGDKPRYELMIGTHTATLKGEKLTGVGTVAIGMEAQLTPLLTIGTHVEGLYGSAVHSHGLKLNLSYRF